MTLSCCIYAIPSLLLSSLITRTRKKTDKTAENKAVNAVFRYKPLTPNFHKRGIEIKGNTTAEDNESMEALLECPIADMKLCVA